MKERPGELRQKIKRLTDSRNELKVHNREKTLQNKKLRDRNVEITESRDHWRARSQELNEDLKAQKKEYEQQVQDHIEEAQRQHRRADEAEKRIETMQEELNNIWKKKSRA